MCFVPHPFQVDDAIDAGLETFHERQTICLADVEAAVKEWTRNAAARDIDGTTALYDPSGGRLLGTVDEATNIRRNTPEAIRECSAAFYSRPFMRTKTRVFSY